ncbi:hypothetical protein EVAR_69228_1 [Eumeta japonica]|uniref:Uncharacterized protein n=1 Tax=Eumeta variegata TaxID=151549 RepID=A0A4C1SMS3_EUMVA|nr:hypothetical protein EVAR_69228_1 [Eumeta japonica]
MERYALSDQRLRIQISDIHFCEAPPTNELAQAAPLSKQRYCTSYIVLRRKRPYLLRLFKEYLRLTGIANSDCRIGTAAANV